MKTKIQCPNCTNDFVMTFAENDESGDIACPHCQAEIHIESDAVPAPPIAPPVASSIAPTQGAVPQGLVTLQPINPTALAALNTSEIPKWYKNLTIMGSLFAAILLLGGGTIYWIINNSNNEAIVENDDVKVVSAPNSLLISDINFPTLGMIGCYPLNGNTNNLIKSTLNGRNHGATPTTDRFGKSGGAFQFAGKKDCLKLPINISPGLMPELTMTCWVKPSFISKPPKEIVTFIIGNDNGSYDRTLVYDSRKARSFNNKHGWAAFAGSYGVLNSECLANGQWTFLAVSYSKNQTLLVVNEEEYKIANSRFNNGFPNLTVGNSALYRGTGFHGAIDDVIIYDKALNISDLMKVKLYGTQWISSQIAEKR